MNRKVLVSFLLFFMFLFSGVHAQRFKGEIIAGMNASQIEGDEVFGFKKFGGNMGMGVMLPFQFNKKSSDKTWAVSMEMLFSQKGSHQRQRQGILFPADSVVSDRYYDSTVKYDLRLNYVSMPIMLHYLDMKTGWTFGVGVAYNRLFGIREIENGMETYTSLSSETYSLHEISVMADIRFRIYRQLKFNFRYEYSLLPIRTRTFYMKEGIPVDPYKRKQYNNMLTFRLIYVFNEPADAVYRKNQKEF